MVRFACFVLGADRPGIVAAVTGALYEADCNLADCSMTILAGHFAMVLVVEAPGGTAPDDLTRTLAGVGGDLDLGVSVRPISERPDPIARAPYVVSVYGADHPGIVARVSALLADLAVNITDLETRVIGDHEPVYAMLLEVEVPESLDPTDLGARLSERARELGVDVSMHPTDAEIL